MRVSAILGAIPGFSRLKSSRTDDFIDRMSHVYTVVILIIFAVVVSTSQFVGDPIHCWHPAEFKGWYEKYAQYYCWISNTYVVAFTEAMPTDMLERKEREIAYYQWVPLILVFQALLFKIPNIIWKLMHSNSGLNLNKVVDLAEKTNMANATSRFETIEHLALHIDKWLRTEQHYHRNKFVNIKERVSRFCCLICSKRSGTYLSALFLFVKILYVVNVIGQFFLLNAFMAMDYNVYGFEVLHGLQTKTPWRESPRFPRVTFCDFEIRQLQNVQRFTIQCVLPINLFNEKIFIFLWFWFFFIAALAVYNLLSWSFIVLMGRSRANYVKKYLKLTGKIQNGFDKKLCQRFADSYLREDGVFVMRVITRNSTDLVTTDLVTQLWKIFQENQSPRLLHDEGSLRPNEHSEKMPLPVD